MKLFILTDRAVLLGGNNHQRVSVIKDGAPFPMAGVLTIGNAIVTVVDGYGDLPALESGRHAVSFTDADGIVYDAGIVVFNYDGIYPAVDPTNAVDALLTEATKIHTITADLSRLADEVVELRGKVEYQGLGFIVGKGE